MASTVVVFVCITGFFTTISAHSNDLNNLLFSGNYEFIDLTHPFDNETLYWHNTQKFMFTKITEKYKDDGSWFAAKEFVAGEHGGTHIDAPYHFSASGMHVGTLPVDKLIVPLIIVNISSQVNGNPDYVLYKQNLDYLLNDNFGKPCLIIFDFGWSKYFHDRNKYFGVNRNDASYNFPGLSDEIAEWITSTYKNVVGIGIDLASVDPGSSTNFSVHKKIAQAGLYIVENVKLNRSIPEYGCTAVALPMKIAEGSGAPLRLVAICPKSTPITF